MAGMRKVKAKGTKIVYSREQEPVQGQPITAEFSSGICCTPCPHNKDGTPKVGSLSCSRCEHFGGSECFGLATGGSHMYGGIDMTRRIYCKFEACEA